MIRPRPHKIMEYNNCQFVVPVEADMILGLYERWSLAMAAYEVMWSDAARVRFIVRRAICLIEGVCWTKEAPKYLLLRERTATIPDLTLHPEQLAAAKSLPTPRKQSVFRDLVSFSRKNSWIERQD